MRRSLCDTSPLRLQSHGCPLLRLRMVVASTPKAATRTTRRATTIATAALAARVRAASLASYRPVQVAEGHRSATARQRGRQELRQSGGVIRAMVHGSTGTVMGLDANETTEKIWSRETDDHN